MLTILIVALFLSLTLMLFALFSAMAAPASSMQERLRVLLGRRTPPSSKPVIRERVEQALEPFSKVLPRSPSEVSRTRAWLMKAGLRESRYLTVYFGLRVFCMIAGALAVGAVIRFEPDKLMLVVLAAAFGYFLPRFFLKRIVAHRQRAIQLGLPDALDLAIICVEAGLSLDHALQRVGQELQLVHPELSDELRLITLEIQAGKTRAEALRNFALRVDIDDVRALVAVLLQTDRFGTSVAQALRIHSDALRTERRQRAEEAAAKTTIKMVPVLVFLVFPPMFFVTMGPAVIELVRTVLPVLNH